ncbi:hypothetical protein HCN44_003271 [Aphidius gifuensis]|uniref:non-specific serine/threonine protein kinase n=1 Tax=Aphidius gifuensis TaxID=684658 RepID=A0A835CK64_APHGI|nr:cell division cycle 7-related protein kinase-like [Aphidius gifuensis]KAF7987509.1 hypothetical protein HCN44_003271 [Aphidius gifuensis]
MSVAANNSQNGEEETYQEAAIEKMLDNLPVLRQLFNVHFKIGEGTFSNVYLATMKSSKESKKFAIKHLIPTYPENRIARELQCLQEIGGADNVVGIEFCVRNEGSVAFVMPYMRHTKFTDYFYNMDNLELKNYMRALMIALRKVHLFNVLHRDVKPSNFLYDRRNRKYLLVDFGLAQNCNDTKALVTKQQVDDHRQRKKTDENNRKLSTESLNKSENLNTCNCFGKPSVCSICTVKPSQVASRAGTPGYRAPEVLFKYIHQTSAIDIWASGIIMLCIMSATLPFFRCPDDCTALAEITTVFGTTKMTQCARKLGKKFITSETLPGIDLKTLCQKLRSRSKSPQNDKTPLEENYSTEAYDLLTRLLDVDFKTRITADEALNHPFLKV